MRITTRFNDDVPFWFACIVNTIILGLYILGSAIATNYLFAIFLHKNISFWGDALIGIIGGSVIVPVAIVIWMLKTTGIL